MSFKDNLREKIRIDRLTDQVFDTLGQPASGSKIDKTAMRNLLETAGYQGRTEREMELYARAFTDDKEKILVLDNELKMYHTTVADVLLRKNPYTREMINIRNIKKILNDHDVIVTQGQDTIRTIRKQCLKDLDLSYTADDIEAIYNDGIDALEQKKARQLIEVLDMFAELLQLAPPPKAARISDLTVYGRLHESETQRTAYGPIILYIRSAHHLTQFEQTLSASAMQKPDSYKELAYGDEAPALEDHAVLDDLKKQVLAQAGAAVAVE